MSDILDMEELRNDPIRLRGVISQLSFDAKLERGLRANAEEEVNRLATENATLTRERDELKKRLEAADGVDRWMNEVVHLAAEVEALCEEIERLDKTIKALTDERDELKRRLDEAENRAMHAEAALDDEREAHQHCAITLTSERDELKEEIERLNKTVEALTNDNARLLLQINQMGEG